MMSQKVIIVGGVAGGASTAARLRRMDETAEIMMIEKGEYISFANCGLPYHIGEVITNRNQLIVQSVEAMTKKFNLDIRTQTEAVKIYPQDKKIDLLNHQTGQVYQETYDTLVLSPGAQPIKPNIKGIENCTNLFTLRNLKDMDEIKHYIATQHPKRATVVGGGFIGLEMAENLYELGLEITLVEASSQVMAPLDFEMASIVHQHLIDKGVNLILQDGVSSFENEEQTLTLNSGRQIETDLVILSIGVRPETSIAKEAGLAINERGGIIVDSYLKTSDPSIYALGDAIEVKDFVNGQATMIPLAWPANRQGHLVADNIVGKQVAYKGTLGSSVAKVFDYTVASTGNNEKTLQHLGLNYQAVHIHPSSHASYYPGSAQISFKLLFDPQDGRILGAQGVGLGGVEKRIDVLSMAIKGGLTVEDLQDFEPCYAPPFNSAKDPVNLMGYYAVNIMEGLVKTVQYSDVDSLDLNESVILDVRESFEMLMGSIPNSINIPLGQLRHRLNELPVDKKIYITCQVGLRGYVACRLLMQHGFDCYNIDGGYKTYQSVKALKVNKDSDEKGEKIIKETQSLDVNHVDIKLNACGLQCPGPIRRVFEEINAMEEGQILEVKASDPGFTKDIEAWCDKTGNTLMSTKYKADKKEVIAIIQKGIAEKHEIQSSNAEVKKVDVSGATLVVFSGDLDKALASFIIATGAASMGKPVTMFFTFWGLNILKKEHKPSVDKDLMGKMFDMMLPNHAGQLPLSQMNMMGAGSAMIKSLMKKHNVDDLPTLIRQALDMGIQIVACSMSMELMGIQQAELIDGIEIGGVASYLGSAEDSNVNLFIS